MTTTYDLPQATNLMTTVALTRISAAGAAIVTYTTNEGGIAVVKDMNGKWLVTKIGAARPFVTDLATLEDAIDFILGARAMMAPA